MKRTQIALAAVALVASSAALADVKVAGCVDATVVNTSAGTALGGYGDGCASQFGLYGSEDIGGMKASFNLETGFSTANGAIGNGGNASSTGFFNRLANVGLGTKEATLTLGMAKSAWIEAAAGGLTAYGMNGVGVPALAIMNGNLSGTSQSGGFFVGNLVGVSGDLGVASYNLQTTVNKASSGNTFYEDNTNTIVNANLGKSDSYSALRVTAPIGEGSVNFGYENRKNTTGLDSGNIDYNNMVFSGSMPIGGGITLNAAYNRTRVGSGNDASNAGTVGSNGVVAQNAYILGASYKVSDAIGVGTTYAKNDAATAASMWALSGQYTLSARTALYANYVDFTNAAAINNGGTAQPTQLPGDTAAAYSGRLISIGAQHSF